MSKRYILRLHGTCSTMPWQFEFYQPSDEMARDYCRRLLANDPCAQQAMGAWLFDIETENNVGTFRIKRETKVEVES